MNEQPLLAEPTGLNILIIDDHRLFLAGMATILATLANKVQVFQAVGAEQALACVDEHLDLDWIFLDLQLPEVDGFQLMAALRERRVSAPVVILSGVEDAATVDLALRRGASGFISKSAHKDEIMHALTHIEQTGCYVSANLEQQLRRYRAREPYTKPGYDRLQLSERQRAVLGLMARGYSNKRIARSLFLSENTVKNHVSSLLATFNAENRTQCILEAKKLHLIE